MNFASNITYLRKKLGFSQAEASEKLGIPRTTLGDYERGYTEPDMVLLHKISKMYMVPLDDLFERQLEKEQIEISQLSNLRILTVSSKDFERNNIELVNTKAQAGYLESYNAPEFIRDLPKIEIPKLNQGHYRGFEITGDSMLPVEPGAIVICKYVERIEDIKNKMTYVIISKREGVVYKRVINDTKSKQLILISDNEVYAPYCLEYKDIDEVWAFKAYIGFVDPKIIHDQLADERITDIQGRLKSNK